jgi:DNA-binding MarR family transcriptional regulator
MQAELPRMLLDAFRALNREIVAGMADRGVWGLRPSHASAMLLIDRTGTRLSHVAARAGTTRQAMMQVVDDLERLGMVRRTPDPDDARARLVKLTAKGLRSRAQARRALTAVEARARRRLGDRRYEALRVSLADLAAEEE